MTKDKIIVVLGQTSTGKSDFAVELALKINGEIISADSRQVYKKLNLGTGKITDFEMKNVPHHLLDVCYTKKIFSVSDFVLLANVKIKEIIKRGNTPIICGGTGFYIDTLINGQVLPVVPPNKELRAKLNLKSTIELFELLKKLDPKRAQNIDKNNKVRLIRAIEIVKTLGKVPILNTNENLFSKSPSDINLFVLKIGLSIPTEILKERIYNRIINRIKIGMIEEVKELHNNGLSWIKMYSLGLEYRYISQYLKNILSKEEMIDILNKETWKYAKRQNTWFKRDKEIIWINPLNNSEKINIINRVKLFLK